MLASKDGVDIEYVAVCDRRDVPRLEEVDKNALLAIAARVGKTRLIDNALLMESPYAEDHDEGEKFTAPTVTDSNVDYQGGIAIDEPLIEKAAIISYEQADIYNITNGGRFTAYAIVGPMDSGVICINGAKDRARMPVHHRAGLLFAILSLLSVIASAAERLPDDAITGTWMVAEKDAYIEIYRQDEQVLRVHLVAPGGITKNREQPRRRCTRSPRWGLSSSGGLSSTATNGRAERLQPDERKEL